MLVYVKPENYQEYDDFVASHPMGHFMQTRMWAAHKSEWSFEGLLSKDENGNIRGSLGLLVRKVPMLPYTIMYGGRGPICDPDDSKTIIELVNGAIRLAKKHNSYVFKLDPAVRLGQGAYGEVLKSLGFSDPPENKNFESIQPRFVYWLDIAGRTEENVFNAFESKTRYNIRLAQKKGVTVEQADGDSVMEFTKIMRETGQRDNFLVRDCDYFKSMLQNLNGHAKLFMAKYEGKPIAGAICIFYAGKAWYLYGASSNENRNVMPNYLLQWEMIRTAIERGCSLYDFRGVSGDMSPENPLYGLYRFKKGFSGELVEFIGEYSLTLIPRGERLVKLAKKARSAVLKVKSALRGK